MADVDVVLAGWDETWRGVDRLPDAVTAELQAVAAVTAARVQYRARQLLRTNTHGHGDTARAIGIVENRRGKVYLVISQAPRGKPSNLPIWIEYGTENADGTVHMDAKPYIRPALYGEAPRYRSLSLAAALRALQQVFR